MYKLWVLHRGNYCTRIIALSGAYRGNQSLTESAPVADQVNDLTYSSGKDLKTHCSPLSGSGAVLPKGHLRPGQSALYLRGDPRRRHAPPAAQTLRAPAGLPGGRLPATRQRLQLTSGAAGSKRSSA